VLFSYIEERSVSPALDLTYHLAPWDQPIFEANTGVISSICLRTDIADARSIDAFRDWCKRNEVKLVSCRLAQNRLVECAFLEAQGFRFIELNYRPAIVLLGGFPGDAEISICPADLSDTDEISGIAAQIFETGRLHLSVRKSATAVMQLGPRTRSDTPDSRCSSVRWAAESSPSWWWNSQHPRPASGPWSASLPA
jgi:hypothetical protein